jgi:transcription elongation factor GreA
VRWGFSKGEIAIRTRRRRYASFVCVAVLVVTLSGEIHPDRGMMMITRIPMTVRGENLLREELAKLKTVERSRIINAIAEARAHGDLKENAEYHAAREQQAFVEGRIQEIEAKLSGAYVIDVTRIEKNGKVVFGTTVTLARVASAEEVIYRIVGEDEADIAENRISITSPIARALIGKEEGDTVSVQAPEGIVKYEIIQVAYL